MATKDEYVAKFKDPRWQQMRLKVMERDAWSCRGCKETAKTLNAHHSYYIFGNDPWEYPIESIVTLCDECHDSQHANWDCDNLREAFCRNGFWSVYQRGLFASWLDGEAGDRGLTEDEARGLCRIVLSYAASVRGKGGLANNLLALVDE